MSNVIRRNTSEKILDYILKSANRFKSIKDFNSKDLVENAQAQIDQRGQSPESQGGQGESKKELDFNAIIMKGPRDRRDVLKEIICDYPETRKKIQLEDDDASFISQPNVRKETLPQLKLKTESQLSMREGNLKTLETSERTSQFADIANKINSNSQART